MFDLLRLLLLLLILKLHRRMLLLIHQMRRHGRLLFVTTERVAFDIDSVTFALCRGTFLRWFVKRTMVRVVATWCRISRWRIWILLMGMLVDRLKRRCWIDACGTMTNAEMTSYWHDSDDFFSCCMKRWLFTQVLKRRWWSWWQIHHVDSFAPSKAAGLPKYWGRIFIIHAICNAHWAVHTIWALTVTFESLFVNVWRWSSWWWRRLIHIDYQRPSISGWQCSWRQWRVVINNHWHRSIDRFQLGWSSSLMTTTRWTCTMHFYRRLLWIIHLCVKSFLILLLLLLFLFTDKKFRHWSKKFQIRYGRQ